MAVSGPWRLVVANRNVPNMVGQITTILADAGVNIADMLNRSRGDLAYNIIDTESAVSGEVLEKIRGIEGVIMTRMIEIG